MASNAAMQMAGGTHHRSGHAALPLDVRLMNASAAVLAVLLGAALVAAAWQALQRSPGLALARVELQGELQRNSLASVRALALPALQGHFLALDLPAAQAAFEGLPWVRKAVVRRVWPDRVLVRLEEHVPVALWQRLDDTDNSSDIGSDASNGAPVADRLVNQQGEVFEANVGELADEQLPTLTGPEGTSALMWPMHQRLAPVLADAGLVVTALHLSGRLSWRAELDTGAVLELGRGTEAELLARSQRFARTLKDARSRFGNAALDSADLRHPGGYALRLRGVTTAAAGPAANR